MGRRVTELWKAIKGDGCTASPDLFYKRCCNTHDRHYATHEHNNGAPITKAEADKRLFQCMRKAGKTPIVGKFIIPAIYWTAVTLFGGKFWKRYERVNNGTADNKK